MEVVKIIFEIIGGLKEHGPTIVTWLNKIPVFIQVILAIFVSLWGYHAVRERDAILGFQMAFMDSSRIQIERETSARADQMQAELRHIVSSNAAIQRVLSGIVESDDPAPPARARVAIIHNGVVGVTGIGMLRFDIHSSFSGPGRKEGEAQQNLPLSQWNDYMPTLLQKKCVFQRLSDITIAAAKARMESMGISSFIACPMIDTKSQILGALFVSWDAGDRMPEKPNDLMDRYMTAATRIADALESVRE